MWRKKKTRTSNDSTSVAHTLWERHREMFIICILFSLIVTHVFAHDCAIFGRMTVEFKIDDAMDTMTVGGCSRTVADKFVSQLLGFPSNISLYGTVASAVIDESQSSATCTEFISSTTATTLPSTTTTDTSSSSSSSTTIATESPSTTGQPDTTSATDTTPLSPSLTAAPMTTMSAGTTSPKDAVKPTEQSLPLPLIFGVVGGCALLAALALLVMLVLCKRRRGAPGGSRRASSTHNSVGREKRARSARSSGHYRRNSEMTRSGERGRSRIYANAPAQVQAASVQASNYGFVPGDIAMRSLREKSSEQAPYGFMPALSAASGNSATYTQPPSSPPSGMSSANSAQYRAGTYVSVPESTYLNSTMAADAVSNEAVQYAPAQARDAAPNVYAPAPSTALLLCTIVALLACGVAQMSTASTVLRIELSGVNQCQFDAGTLRAELLQLLRDSQAYDDVVVDLIASRLSVFNTPRFTLGSSCAVPCRRLTALSGFKPWDELNPSSDDWPSLCVGRAINGHLFGLGIPTLQNWPSEDLNLIDLPDSVPLPPKRMSFKSHYNPPGLSGRLEVLQGNGRVRTAAPEFANLLFGSLFEFNVDLVTEPACYTSLQAVAPHVDAAGVENRRTLSVRHSHHWVYLHGAVRVDRSSGSLLFVVAPDVLPPREYRILTTASIDTTPEQRYAVNLEVKEPGLIEAYSDFGSTSLFNQQIRTFHLDNVKWERNTAGEALSGAGDDPLDERKVIWLPISVFHANAKSVAVGSFLFASCSLDRDMVHLGGRFKFSDVVLHASPGTYFVGNLPPGCPPPPKRVLLSVGTSSSSLLAFPTRLDISVGGALLFVGLATPPTTSYVWSLDGLSYNLNDEVV